MQNFKSLFRSERAVSQNWNIEKNRSAVSNCGATKPLHILAIGDSWFQYPLTDQDIPLPFYDQSIIHHLSGMGNPAPIICNLAYHGQTMAETISLGNQITMRQLLDDKTNWVCGKPDVILISGGGDDIVGDQFVELCTINGLNSLASSDAMNGVVGSYISTIEFFSNLNVPILVNSYDYAIPNGVGVLWDGPWLKPSLDYVGQDYQGGLVTVKNLIDLFNIKLSYLSSIDIIDVRGTLTRDTSTPLGWLNEIHPFSSGFHAIAQKYLAKLQTMFPGRI